MSTSPITSNLAALLANIYGPTTAGQSSQAGDDRVRSLLGSAGLKDDFDTAKVLDFLHRMGGNPGGGTAASTDDLATYLDDKLNPAEQAALLANLSQVVASTQDNQPLYV